MIQRPIPLTFSHRVAFTHGAFDPKNHTLRDLVARGEKDMVEIRNFGEKSLKEVRDKLEVLGLGFGMNLDL